MKKLFAALLLLMSVCVSSQAQSFSIDSGHFMLNGKPMRIYGGEMHYARIPREYWRQRIKMVKAMGCNTISIYVFWNYHETSPGLWDWSSDNHDLRSFILLAKAEGMYIVLRPGPYTCAEWDFGGFPYWLSTSPAAKVRSNSKPFLDSCRTYLQQVYRQVDGLFIEQGGNIIMTQVENEYGSFSFDMQFKISHRERRLYMENLANIFREVGFKHTLFTCDGGILPVINFARLGHIKGMYPGTNDSKFLNVAHHTVRKFYNKKGPYFIPEEYAGWFTHWGDEHVFHRDVEKYKTHIEELLKTDFSFCYYMVHGGTNFGFMSGSNHRAKNDVWPVITSYDYGAPIDEAGNATPLYDSLRAVYQRYSGSPLYDLPQPIKSMSIPPITLDAISLSNLGILGQVVHVDSPLTFERLGQAGGYVWYEPLDQKLKGKVRIKGLGDFAQIIVNDSVVYTINKNVPGRKASKTIRLNLPKESNLYILAEQMGRVNFGRKLWGVQKGLTGSVQLNGKPLTEWMKYKLPMTEAPDMVFDDSLKQDSYKADYPQFYGGAFHLQDTADTYLDMHGFGKGIVFVNGHSLGRYWEIGPQYSLYIPGVLLKKGRNEIVIFDQINHKRMHSISATAKPVNR